MVILLIYKSLLLPVLLIGIIQTAVWLAFSINVMISSPVFFMAYILVNCIQMATTIDYAIMLSGNYINNRKTMPKGQAIKAALKSAIPPIMTSGLVMVIAAFCIYQVSTSIAISSIGNFIWRGALVSVALVVFALPQVLLLFDKWLEKTTYQANFFKGDAPLSEEKGESSGAPVFETAGEQPAPVSATQESAQQGSEPAPKDNRIMPVFFDEK
jgi:uncharacterized membrane protein YdfJ with MMPL/SSD domain